MKRTLYVVGNTFVADDQTAVLLVQSINIKELFHVELFDPTETIPTENKHPLFIDTVRGIQEITIFDSLNPFSKPPTTTLHDYDLYQELMLLTKTKQIESFTIIGIPVVIHGEKTKQELYDILNTHAKRT